MGSPSNTRRTDLVKVTASPLSKSIRAEIADVAKAIGDPQRVGILYLLAVASEPVCVVDLEHHLDVAQSTVSHHLKVLVDAGVCDREARGRWSYYSIRAEVLAEFRHRVERLVQFPSQLAQEAT